MNNLVHLMIDRRVNTAGLLTSPCRAVGRSTIEECITRPLETLERTHVCPLLAIARHIELCRLVIERQPTASVILQAQACSISSAGVHISSTSPSYLASHTNDTVIITVIALSWHAFDEEVSGEVSR